MKQFKIVMSLSKSRLSLLVAATALGGFVAASGEAIDWTGAAYNGVGTWLVSASASTVNQIMEKHSDSLMNRTRTRPLPSGRVSPRAAAAWAAVSGAAGLAALAAPALGDSVPAAQLGAINWILYVAVYTPLKRLTPWQAEMAHPAVAEP